MNVNIDYINIFKRYSRIWQTDKKYLKYGKLKHFRKNYLKTNKIIDRKLSLLNKTFIKISILSRNLNLRKR